MSDKAAEDAHTLKVLHIGAIVRLKIYPMIAFQISHIDIHNGIKHDRIEGITIQYQGLYNNGEYMSETMSITLDWDQICAMLLVDVVHSVKIGEDE